MAKTHVSPMEQEGTGHGSMGGVAVQAVHQICKVAGMFVVTGRAHTPPFHSSGEVGLLVRTQSQAGVQKAWHTELPSIACSPPLHHIHGISSPHVSFHQWPMVTEYSSHW